jgi:16S rRNA (uracil1498-N3)-methyltransferase
MHRFFVKPDQISDTQVRFLEQQVDQLVKVLRINLNDRVTILDNTGWEYEVIIRNINRNNINGEIVNKAFPDRESPVKVNLFVSLLKKDNLEWVFQKGTELGIHHFTPMICARTIIRYEERSQKMERWTKIIQEASEQSTRSIKPGLSDPIFFQAALKDLDPKGLNMIAWEKETRQHVKSVLGSITSVNIPSSVNIFIGPEGGFTEEEIKSAEGFKLLSVSLGKRILRSETAAIAASSIILSYFDDL